MTTVNQRVWLELLPSQRRELMCWLADPRYSKPSQVAAAAVLAELCDEDEQQRIVVWVTSQQERLI